MRDNAGVKEFYSNGQLEWFIPYVNQIQRPNGTFYGGVPHGVAKQFYPDGSLKLQRTYVNGKVEGIEKLYFANGKPWMETPFKNGKHDGVVYMWRPDGTLETETTYHDDERHGPFRRFNDKGEVIEQGEYERGTFKRG